MKAAFVVQRYGLEVNGGGEMLCRQVAERMARHWDLEILTTCAVDYTTWEDHYPAGVSVLNGVNVRRFRVDFPRVGPLFNRISESVFAKPGCPELEPRWAREQGPYSSDFLRFLEEQGDRYDLFIFFTYLYGLTYFGLPKVADRSLLLPTAHDEPPFHLSIYQEIFRAPKGFLFLTPEEQQLVESKYGTEVPGTLVGAGIDDPGPINPTPFLQRHQGRITKPFLLYLGRIDESKGCRELFDFFIRYRSETGSQDVQLVLIGKPVMEIPNHPDIVPLGFVSEEEKFQALAAAEALIMPSPYESLSMVILESWSVTTPTLVNARCEVLKGQSQRSEGGTWYSDYASFRAELSKLLADPSLRQKLGQNGRKFVLDYCTWDTVEQHYLACGEWGVANRIEATRRGRAVSSPPRM